MEEFPAVTDLGENPTETGTGHLWILELVEGVPLRFTMRSDGRIEFGDSTSGIDPETAPPAIRPAIDTVRTRFRRDAFRDAVGDVSTVTFFGVGTCQHRIDYDWGRLPAFVGYDVHAPVRDGLLAPEAAHAIFDRLGLVPAPAIERERRADSFDPDGYEFPDSAWAEAAVAGLRLADKHGWRGRLDNPDRPARPSASFDDAAGAVETLVGESLLQSLGTDDPVEELSRRLAREHRAELLAAGIDPSAEPFRRAVGKTVGHR